MFGDKDLNWENGEGVISVSVKEPHLDAVYISTDLGDSVGTNHAGIVPAWFHTRCFLNNSRYMESDKNPWNARYSK